MDNGINPELNAMLSLAWQMGYYIREQSYWRVNSKASLTFSGTVVPADIPFRFTYKIYSNWKQTPPTAACYEKWIRRDIDWHVYETGSLCWVYPPMWRDVLQEMETIVSPEELVEIAAYWCVSHSCELASKHLKADQIGYRGNWPKEWDQWQHHDKAIAQYAELKKGLIEQAIQQLLAQRNAYKTKAATMNAT